MATTYQLPSSSATNIDAIRAAMSHDVDRLVGAYRSFVTACGAAYPDAHKSVNGVLGGGKSELDASTALGKKLINFAIGGVMTLALGPAAGPLARWAIGTSTDAAANQSNSKTVGGLVGKGAGWASSKLTDLLVAPTSLNAFSVGEDPVVFLAKLLNSVTNFEQALRNEFAAKDDTTDTANAATVRADFLALQRKWPEIPMSPDGSETWVANHLFNPLRRSLWLAWILARDKKWWFARGNATYEGGSLLPYLEGLPPKTSFQECTLSSSNSDEWLFRHCVPALSELRLAGKYYRLNIRWASSRQVQGDYVGTCKTVRSVSGIDATHGLNIPNLLLWAQPQLGLSDQWIKMELTGLTPSTNVAALLQGSIGTLQLPGKK